MNEYGLDFGQTYGAGQGNVGNIQDIMAYFFDLLKQREQGGDDENRNWMDIGAGQAGSERGYNLGQYQDWLSGWNEGTDDDPGFKPTADLLSSMIGGSGIQDLTKGYGQDMGDISSEFGSQLQGLQKGYGAKSKGGRYGKIGTGGRNIMGGGRNKYMSDIYGLQQKQHEMQQEMQDKFMSDFYGNMATWQGLNPVPLPDSNNQSGN